MRTITVIWLFLIGIVFAATILVAQGQAPQHAVVITPDSTQERPEHIGKKAHTNHLILGLPKPMATTPMATTPSGETPQSIYPVYGLTFTGGGGAGIIAIVDAFDYPTAEYDLNYFSSQFGLPPCTSASGCFRVVYASGTKPSVNCGWAQEAALDIEWAHAMAPDAKIVLVEAASNSFSDLFRAVDVATREVLSPSGPGFGQVSMSWGGSEFSTERNYDSRFTDGVVYFAASGDSGGKTIYPCVSPNVVCAGGTTINRNSAGKFLSETAWSGSGGGPSKYEPQPPYQTAIVDIVGSKRGAPDFSFDANPYSGVSVYDTTPCQGMSGWLVFGGTSVSSPALAGIVNLAGSKYSSSANELGMIYADYKSPSYPTDFRDITSGKAGKFTATKGWDFVTGVGSNQGVGGK